MNRCLALVVTLGMGCMARDPDLQPAPSPLLVSYSGCEELEQDLESRQFALARGGARTRDLGEYDLLRITTVVSGHYLYVADGGRVLAIDLEGATPLVQASSTAIEGLTRGLWIDGTGTRLVVASRVRADNLPASHPLAAIAGDQPGEDYEGGGDPYEEWLNRRQKLTKLSIFDLATPASPLLVREVYTEGSIKDLAIAGPTLLWVSRAQIVHSLLETDDLTDITQMTLADFTPQLIDHVPDGGFAPEAFDCSRVGRSLDTISNGFISIRSLDLTQPTSPITSTHLLGNDPSVRIGTSVVIGESTTPLGSDAVNIHLFSRSLRYQGSGRLDGVLPGEAAAIQAEPSVTVVTNVDSETFVSTFEPSSEAVPPELEPVASLNATLDGFELGNPAFAGDRLILRKFSPTLFVGAVEVDISDRAAPRVLGDFPEGVGDVFSAGERLVGTSEYAAEDQAPIIYNFAPQPGAAATVAGQVTLPTEVSAGASVDAVHWWPVADLLTVATSGRVDLIRVEPGTGALSLAGALTQTRRALVLDDSVIAESLTGLARRSLPALDLQGEVPLEGETNISEWWPR